MVNLFLSLGIAITGLLSIPSLNNNLNSVNNEVDGFKTTLGPAIINVNHQDYINPETRGNINNNRNVEFRDSTGQGNYYLLLNPKDCSYMNIPFNTHLDLSFNDNTWTGTDAYRMEGVDLTKIKLYKDKTTSYTLQECLTNNIDIVFNIFTDHCLNVAFKIDPSKFNAAKDLYKFEIEKDFVYPVGDNSVRYVQENDVRLINGSYGVEGSGDIIFATSWNEEKIIDEDITYVPIGVGSRNDSGYRIHFRTNQSTDDFCSLILFFDLDKYNPELNGLDGSVPQYNIPVSNDYFDKGFYYENLYKKIHLNKTVGADSVKVDLYDIADLSVNPTYNLFGEKGAIGFRLEAHDGNVYNAFSQVEVESGCTFPSFATTNGKETKNIIYQQFTTISFNAIEPSATQMWSVRFDYIFKLGDVTIKSIVAEDLDIHLDGGSIKKPFVTIKFNEEIYKDVPQNTDCSLYYDQNILYSIFVNGHSLNFLNKENPTTVIINANKDGANTISYSVGTINEAKDITNVIMNNAGCNIPMVCSDPSVKSTYGACPYFKLSENVSYSRTSGSEPFVLDSEIVYTIWFDMQNPIKVKGKKAGQIVIYRWDTSNKPIDPTKDKHIFNCWVDERGNKLEDGNPQITGCVDYTSDWIKLCTLKLDLGDGKVNTFDGIKEGTRLSSIEDVRNNSNPKKDGYFLNGWVDENNNAASLDNKIYNDLTLKAVWVKLNNGTTTGGGCGGSVVAVSSIVSIVTIIGAILLIVKKKKEC